MEIPTGITTATWLVNPHYSRAIVLTAQLKHICQSAIASHVHKFVSLGRLPYKKPISLFMTYPAKIKPKVYTLHSLLSLV